VFRGLLCSVHRHFIGFLLCTIFFYAIVFPNDCHRASQCAPPQRLPLFLSVDNSVIGQNAVCSYCRANFVFDFSTTPELSKNCAMIVGWKRLVGLDVPMFWSIFCPIDSAT
jgi:hypothetical protein